MRSVSINVEKLRNELGLKQAELAAMLCVTQATVARWESEDGKTQPAGDAARRLEQLNAMMDLPKEFKVLRETLKSTGGISAVAALLSLGTSMGIAGVGTLFGPFGIAQGVAAGVLYRVLKRAQNESKKRKDKRTS